MNEKGVIFLAKEKKVKEVNNHPNKIGFKDVAGYTIAESGNMFTTPLSPRRSIPSP